MLVADVGYAKDAQQIQTNIVRVDGQTSVYLPVLKQGGDSNTIAVVNGREASRLEIWSMSRSTGARSVVFDQSRVREDGDREPAARRRASAWS